MLKKGEKIISEPNVEDMLGMDELNFHQKVEMWQENLTNRDLKSKVSTEEENFGWINDIQKQEAIVMRPLKNVRMMNMEKNKAEEGWDLEEEENGVVKETSENYFKQEKETMKEEMVEKVENLKEEVLQIVNF